MIRAQLAILAALGLSACSKHDSGAYEAALARAAGEKKVVMIDFFTTWCGPCKRLEQETWKAESVRAWFDAKAVKLALDAEQERELAQRFHVDAYPTLVFVNPDGRELGRIVGFRDAEHFLDEADEALLGKDPTEHARAALIGHENNPMERQSLGDALERAGKYDEALAQYLWCFDEGVQHSPAYAGVRGSFLVSRLGDLARKHPPAREALLARRGPIEQKALAPNAASPDVLLLGNLNQALGEERRNLELFDELGARGPEGKKSRQLLMLLVMDTLLEKQRYADLLDNAGDIATKLEKKSAKLAAARAKSSKQGAPEAPFPDPSEFEFAHSGQTYYECLLGTQRFAEAARVADVVLGARTETEVLLALVRAAHRTHAFDQGRELVARWIHKLPESAESQETLRRDLEEHLR